MKTKKLMCNNIVCTNPLMIQNHNVILFLNEFFSDYPKGSITKKEFMELQQMVWKEVKKELGIKINE